jgi:hypothetical protein
MAKGIPVVKWNSEDAKNDVTMVLSARMGGPPMPQPSGERARSEFKRGITEPEFVGALKKCHPWQEIMKDEDLYIAIRKEYINIYYQGCSIFKISYKKGPLVFETHYKYLVHPNMNHPLISWEGESPAVEDRVSEIFINKFDLGLLKKSSCAYAEPEKVGVHSILKSNKNVVDVEIALSHESENETDDEEQNPKGKQVADRIDFAAIQRKDGKPCIVFFEAKCFENGELRSQKLEPAVIKQIEKYETFIEKYRPDLEESYRTVCRNIVDLVPPDRYDPLVKEVADSPEQLTVDPHVRLVVFGYDADQNDGKVWNKHKEKLLDHFKNRLLLKGSPREFTVGISEMNLKVVP